MSISVKNININKQSFIKLLKWIVAATVLGVLIIQSLFVSPQMDDYSWFYVQEKYANDSFWASQTYFYKYVNGRVFATLISSVLMCKELLNAYNLIVLSVNISFFILLIYIIKQLVKSKTDSIYITAIFLLSFLAYIKEPQSYLYWLSGMIVYQISTVFILISILLYLKLLRKESNNIDLILFIIVSSCSILIFEFSFPVIILAVSVIFWLNTEKTTRNWRILILISILLTIFFLLNLNAPGNLIKSLQYGSSKAHNLEETASYLIQNIKAITTPKKALILSAWICFLLFMPISLKERKNGSKEGLLVILISFVYLLVLNLFYFYKIGSPSPYRVDNFNLFWFLVIFSAGFLFLKPSIIEKLSKIKFKNNLHFIFAVFLAYYSYNFRHILSDIIRGKSYSYYQQIKNRAEIINSCNEDICYVKPITNLPKTIIYVELPQDSLDANEFYCRQLAKFHNKKWVFQQK